MLECGVMQYYAFIVIAFLIKEERFVQIKEFQYQAIIGEKVNKKKKQQKGMMNELPSKISLSCRHCQKLVCSGEDIEVIENMHHVNVTNQFR